MDTAFGQIKEQQKKLTDTGELVRAMFTNSRLEIFDTTKINDNHFIVREGQNNRRVVYMLLHEIPIPPSVQVQFHVYSQPRNSYVALGNLLVFFWADPVETLKQHPLAISYVADPTAKTKPISAIMLKDGHVFADAAQLPDFTRLLALLAIHFLLQLSIHLLKGLEAPEFAGKVNLIYIDPPFDLTQP